jgi:hypothetical protein
MSSEGIAGPHKEQKMEKVPTPARLADDFIKSRDRIDLKAERAWLRGIFSCVLKVARRNSTFIIDDVWEQIEAAQRSGRLEKTRLDNRIFGVIFRYLASEGVIDSSGYFVKSTRPGSRPVTVWTSGIYRRTQVAA